MVVIERDWEMQEDMMFDGQKSQNSKKSKEGCWFLCLLIVVGGVGSIKLV